jgi:hypothetical protein
MDNPVSIPRNVMSDLADAIAELLEERLDVDLDISWSAVQPHLEGFVRAVLQTTQDEQ